MAELTKCVECGGAVSSEARTCPHCNKNPRFFHCQCCHRRDLRKSEAIHVLPKNGNDANLFHQSCYESILAQTVHCPVCQNNISYREFVHSLSTSPTTYRISTKSNCPQCGHDLRVGTCGVCVLPISHLASITMQYMSGMSADDSHYIQVQVHEKCVPTAKTSLKAKIVGSSSKSSVVIVIFAIAILLLVYWFMYKN